MIVELPDATAAAAEAERPVVAVLRDKVTQRGRLAMDAASASAASGSPFAIALAEHDGELTAEQAAPFMGEASALMARIRQARVQAYVLKVGQNSAPTADDLLDLTEDDFTLLSDASFELEQARQKRDPDLAKPDPDAPAGSPTAP